MTSRVQRQTGAFKRVALTRRQRGFAPANDQPNILDFALAYSNGYVTVEISQEAVDAYVEMTGNVPLPMVYDPETGDRRTYDARNAVRVVYGAGSTLREISKRSTDGLFVRINFTDGGDASPTA